MKKDRATTLNLTTSILTKHTRAKVPFLRDITCCSQNVAFETHLFTEFVSINTYLRTALKKDCIASYKEILVKPSALINTNRSF